MWFHCISKPSPATLCPRLWYIAPSWLTSWVLPPPAALPKQFPPVEKQREWLGPCWDPRGKLWLPLTSSFESEPNFPSFFQVKCTFHGQSLVVHNKMSSFASDYLPLKRYDFPHPRKGWGWFFHHFSHWLRAPIDCVPPIFRHWCPHWCPAHVFCDARKGYSLSHAHAVR